jgi:hypothetical protein
VPQWQELQAAARTLAVTITVADVHTLELVINLKTAKALGIAIARDFARPRRRDH